MCGKRGRSYNAPLCSLSTRTDYNVLEALLHLRPLISCHGNYSQTWNKTSSVFCPPVLLGPANNPKLRKLIPESRRHLTLEQQKQRWLVSLYCPHTQCVPSLCHPHNHFCTVPGFNSCPIKRFLQQTPCSFVSSLLWVCFRRMQSRWEGRNCWELRDEATLAFGAAWADVLLAQEADSPTPQSLHCPRHSKDAISPGSQERSSNLCLLCTAPTRHIRAQSSGHFPPASLLPTENLFLCPQHVPCPPWPHPTCVLPWHEINFIAHSAKSQPDPWEGLAAGKKRALCPLHVPDTAVQAGQCPEPVPPCPCEVAGDLSRMQVPLCSDCRRTRMGKGLAGRIRLQ
ncbi:uncharacterized protein LOC111937625 isoform X2 [Cyanistes caeruleus]|uniref:uncharacterized protein LOC111937625 isoform X2 n=1 Tax=Cyanistes caeruleus TaxID=156563 RepID=UPI000CDB2111|nr:uncharacterized protein LOC111937625 isoform X2 [Cyanistes caeruleus]